MAYKVDFHIHTWFSDGQMSPTEIVKQAKAQEYDMIAITDHDGIEGVQEAIIAGNALEMKVIPGVELSTKTEDNVNLHILGYHIDIENQNLKGTLEDLKAKRVQRNKKLLKVLADMGYPLTQEDLMTRPGQTYIGKPIIARAMEAKGYIKSFKEAFAPGQMLESDQARAVKKEKLYAEHAIKLIKEAGGIAVLAHPIQIRELRQGGSREFYENLDQLVRKLKKAGLGGMECFHPDHTYEQALEFVAIAEKYHLHITEGSDFHGDIFNIKK